MDTGHQASLLALYFWVITGSNVGGHVIQNRNEIPESFYCVFVYNPARNRVKPPLRWLEFTLAMVQSA